MWTVFYKLIEANKNSQLARNLSLHLAFYWKDLTAEPPYHATLESLYKSNSSTNPTNALSSLEPQRNQATKSQTTVSPAVAFQLFNALGKTAYQRVQQTVNKTYNVASRVHSNRFSQPILPSTREMSNLMKVAAGDDIFLQRKEPLDGNERLKEWCCVKPTLVVQQLLDMATYHKVFDEVGIKGGELIVRISTDATPIAKNPKKFVMISSISLIGFGRLVLSCRFHRVFGLTTIESETLESLRLHMSDEMLESLNHLASTRFTVQEKEVGVHLTFCGDMGVSTKGAGVSSCQTCYVCGKSCSSWASFDQTQVVFSLTSFYWRQAYDPSLLLSPIQPIDREIVGGLYPKGTRAKDILPDMLHNRIDLVKLCSLELFKSLLGLSDPAIEAALWKELVDLGYIPFFDSCTGSERKNVAE